ncbi:MAG: site-specific integrase [Clostridia bacterium]|nr:site-specific integrase [Clostridia bacterium]
MKKLNKTLKQIKREDIQKYINLKYESGRKDGKGGLSSRSVKLHLIIIRQVFKEAIKSNYISNNPCDYVSLPKAERYEASFYTINQLNTLFTAIKDEPLYPLIYCAVVFGLRRSEVLGLKWDSVNFENNTISIKHTVVRYSEIVEKDTTKTNSSYRTYPLSPEVTEMLHTIKALEHLNRDVFGKEYFENDYIFKWENGKPYTPDFISRKFHKILVAYNLPVIRFHDLRHSCASLLVANGFTLKDIQEWLGHADIQTTANIYAHLDVERKNKIAISMVNSLKF